MAQKCPELKIGRGWENVRRMCYMFSPCCYYYLGSLRHCSNQDNQLDGPLIWLHNINFKSFILEHEIQALYVSLLVVNLSTLLLKSSSTVYCIHHSPTWDNIIADAFKLEKEEKAIGNWHYESWSTIQVMYSNCSGSFFINSLHARGCEPYTVLSLGSQWNLTIV